MSSRGFRAALMGVVAFAVSAWGQENALAFGQIQGVLYVNGMPAPSERIAFSATDSEGLQPKEFQGQTVTDGQGHFQFDRVPAREIVVSHYVPFEIRAGASIGCGYTTSHSRVVYVEPGATTEVALRPPGRRVQGRLVLPEECDVDVAWQGTPTRRLVRVIDMPEPPDELSDEDRAQWMAGMRDTDEWRLLRRQFSTILVTVKDDGTFYAADVPPGNYHLQIAVGRNDTVDTDAIDREYARAELDFAVPDDKDTEVVDLGELIVRPNDHRVAVQP